MAAFEVVWLSHQSWWTMILFGVFVDSRLVGRGIVCTGTASSRSLEKFSLAMLCIIRIIVPHPPSPVLNLRPYII